MPLKCNHCVTSGISYYNGIRQGCNASSNLFLLITYCIIEKLYDNLSGVKTNICKMVALFFADDGMILMQSLRETKESIYTIVYCLTVLGLLFTSQLPLVLRLRVTVRLAQI